VRIAIEDLMNTKTRTKCDWLVPLFACFTDIFGRVLTWDGQVLGPSFSLVLLYRISQWNKTNF